MKLTAVSSALGAIALLTVGISATPATAATFTFHKTNFDSVVGLGKRAGIPKAITTTFDEHTQRLTWSSTIARNLQHNSLANGAWLVLSEGPNPRKDTDEYAILYLDGTQQQVSAYHYDGNLGDKSWQSTRFLGSTDLSVAKTDDELTLAFELDASNINGMTETFGPAWKGVAFGENIGLWFHAVDNLVTDYSPSGQLSEFDYKHSSWFDTGVPLATVKSVAASGEGAKDIPEPTSAIALGVFAGIVGLSRRWRKGAAPA